MILNNCRGKSVQNFVFLVKMVLGSSFQLAVSSLIVSRCWGKKEEILILLVHQLVCRLRKRKNSLTPPHAPLLPTHPIGRNSFFREGIFSWKNVFDFGVALISEDHFLRNRIWIMGGESKRAKFSEPVRVWKQKRAKFWVFREEILSTKFHLLRYTSRICEKNCPKIDFIVGYFLFDTPDCCRSGVWGLYA